MDRGMVRGLGVGLWILACAAGAARADVSVDEGGTILMYPKVISANGRDTIIQMTNTGNTLMHVHCYYTDARPRDPRFPPGPTNPPLWQEVDFYLWLTRQQPTSWRVSQGRSLNPLDGGGLDPGSIPGVSSGFTGELVCVEVDSSGNPISANRLEGTATLISTGTGDASRYSAIGIQAGPMAGENGRTLQLDNEHYNSCPNTLILNHFAANAPSPVVGPPDDFGACANGCPIRTEVTLIPCGRDYENQDAGRSTVSLLIYNEFEERFSGSIAVDCWANVTIGGSMSYTVLGSLTAHTRLTPVSTTGGVVGIAEETHTNDASVVSRTAWNLQTEGSFYDPGAGREVVDEIVLVGE